MELKQEQLIQIKVLRRKHFQQVPDMIYIPKDAKVIGVIRIGEVEYALFATAEGKLGSARWVTHMSHYISRATYPLTQQQELEKEWAGFDQLFLD